MPSYFDEGFFVREPAWHKQGVVLADYPGRDEAMELAGHNFEVVPRKIAVEVPRVSEMLSAVAAGDALTSDEPDIIAYGGGTTLVGNYADPLAATDDDPQWEQEDEWKAIVRSDTNKTLYVAKDSYAVIPNSVGWDLLDALVGEGVKYETGLTLKGGAVCIVTAYLDEPTVIFGDNSPILPYVVSRWAHDGTASLSARGTSVRVVCANTDELSRAEAAKLGTEFTFKHTKNWKVKIDDAKMVVKGMRLHHEEFVKLANELAAIKITPAQRELFVTQFIPTPPEALISDRVKRNIDEARGKVRALFSDSNATIPDAHKLTAYGLRLAGTEYIDHLRNARGQDSLSNRQLLTNRSPKEALTTLIREVVNA